jgi:hypothetical protein
VPREQRTAAQHATATGAHGRLSERPDGGRERDRDRSLGQRRRPGERVWHAAGLGKDPGLLCAERIEQRGVITRPAEKPITSGLRAGPEAGPIGSDEPQAQLRGGPGGGTCQTARTGPIKDDDERTIPSTKHRIRQQTPIWQLELARALIDLQAGDVVGDRSGLGTGEQRCERHMGLQRL